MNDELNTIKTTPESRITPFDEKGLKAVVPGQAFKAKGAGPWKKFTARAMTALLNEIANTGVMYRACHAHGVSYTQFAKIRKEYPEIEELVELAREFYREKISHVIHDRAVDGWSEPVFFKGEIIGHVQKFSDRLLELQAKRHCPEYRDRSQVDHSVTGGVLMIPAAPVQDKEAYLAELRKRKAIDSKVVE